MQESNAFNYIGCGKVHFLISRNFQIYCQKHSISAEKECTVGQRKKETPLFISIQIIIQK